MLFVGIDVAKSKHDFCIIDSSGVILSHSLSFPNSLAGFEFLCSTIISFLPDKDLSNVKIGLESTGHYSTNLTNYLYSKGFQIITLNPLAISLFRKAKTLRKTKTDKTDAMVIANMLFSDESKSYSPVSYHINELKSLTRNRHRLINYQSKLKMSFTRLVDIIFPEIVEAAPSLHQKYVYALFLQYPNTNVISNLHLTKLTNLFKKASNNKCGKDKALAIKQLAENSIGSCSPSISFEIQQTIRLIQYVEAEIELLDEQIESIVKELNSTIITIPGISYTLAAIIIAEIGDIKRFSSPSKLLAFAGMEPSTYQSGNYKASNTPMVKRGSTYLRWAVIQASKSVAQNDQTFKEYLDKKRSEGKHYHVAVSHVGKKLIRVIHYLMSNNTEFVSQF